MELFNHLNKCVFGIALLPYFSLVAITAATLAGILRETVLSNIKDIPDCSMVVSPFSTEHHQKKTLSTLCQ